MFDLQPSPGPRALYEGRDLSVRLNDFRTPTVVVTFTHRDPGPGGFLETELCALGVSNLVFLGHANHWWQTPQMAEAVAAVRASGALNGRRTILHGQSMGAYGALAWSAALDADEVIAVCPQFSPDPRVAAFDPRWLEERNALDCAADDLAGGLSRTARVAVIHDPSQEHDARHVAMIAAVRPVDRIIAPFCSHGVLTLTHAPKHVAGFLEVMLAGYDPRALRGHVRRARRSSSRYLYKVCRHLLERGRPREQVRHVARLGAGVGGKEHPKFLEIIRQVDG